MSQRLTCLNTQSKTTVCIYDTLGIFSFDILHFPDWFQMVVDDLPVWGMVGEIPQGELRGQHSQELHDKMHLFTHRSFRIGYNGDQIVEVNITGTNKVEIGPKQRLDFTYDVKWVPSDISFHKVGSKCFL